MVVTPVNLYTPETVKPVKNLNSRMSNPIVTEKENNQENNALGNVLKSYFLGGNAVSFKGFPCSTGNFITKQIDDVPCCCCGGRMVRNSQMGKKAREFSALQGNELAEKLRNEKDFFRTAERTIAMMIADEAETSPDILDMGTAIKRLEPDLKQRTLNYCAGILGNASQIASEAFGTDENPVTALIGSEIEKVKGGKIDRVDFTERLAQYETQMKPEQYGLLQDCVMNLPEDYDAVKHAYGEAYGNSIKAARELLKPSMQTIEHIHPKSKGGPNATQNYIAECYQCNNPRGHMSYAEWLKVHPEYPRKAQDHIEYFQQKMIDGDIPQEYDDYPIDVKASLSKESDGVMELRVLNPEKIRELRELKAQGKEVDVREILEAEAKKEDAEAA